MVRQIAGRCFADYGGLLPNGRARDQDALNIFTGRDGQDRIHDHRTGQSLDAFDAVAVFGLGLSSAKDDFPAVLKATASLLGISADFVVDDAARGWMSKRRTAAAAQQQQLETARREALAATLHLVRERSQPVAGSIAETYQRSRGIEAKECEREAVFLPAGAIQWREIAGYYRATGGKGSPYRIDMPALVLWVRDRGGKITGFQRILLRADGKGKAEDAKVAKPSTGALTGAYAKLPGKAGALLIAEGPETALSVWQSTGCEVWAKCGHPRNIQADDLPKDRPLILCADADDDDLANKLNEKAHELIEAGFDVRIATPPNPAKKGWDFNDTLVRDGEDAIRQAIAAAVPPNDQKPEAFGSENIAAAMAGVEKTKASVKGFFAAELHTKSHRALLTGSQGTGKTRAALEGAIVAADDGKVVQMLFPTLAKAEEAATDVIEMDADPFVVRGRNAVHDGATMCELPDLANDASKAGANVLETVCASCPFREGCRYLEQANQIARHVEGGGIILASHGYLTVRMPGDVKPDIIVVDEMPNGALMPDGALTLTMGEIGKLRPSGRSPGRMADTMAALVAEVRPLATAVLRAVYDHAGREIEALRMDGWTDADAKRAGKVVDECRDRAIGGRVSQAMREGVAAGDGPDGLTKRASKAVAEAAANWFREHVALFTALEVELASDRVGFSGIWAKARRGRDEEGRAVSETAIAFRPMQKPRVPDGAALLCLDGTGDPAIWSSMFGPLAHDHIPVPRRLRATQVIGRTFSDQSITGLYPNGADANVEDAAVLRGKLGRIVNRNPGAFVAGSKRAMRALELHLSEAGATGHFGALRGVNAAETCETAVIIGRTLPSMEALEAQARPIAAKLGRCFSSLLGPDGRWPVWPKQVRMITMRDGSTVTVQIECHPDPTAQAMLEQIREAELAQAIDRVRPIFNDRHLILISPVPVPGLVVDQVERWKDAAAGGTKLDRMAASGVILGGREEAVRCFKEVYGTVRTLGKDAETVSVLRGLNADPSEIFGQEPSYIETIIQKFLTKTDIVLVEYKRPRDPEKDARGGAKPYRALILAPAHQARERLEAVTGTVDHFAVLHDWTAEVDVEVEELAGRFVSDGYRHDAATAMASEAIHHAARVPDPPHGLIPVSPEMLAEKQEARHAV